MKNHDVLPLLQLLLEDRKYEMIAPCHVLPCFFQWLSSLATTEDTPFDVRQVGSSETKVQGGWYHFTPFPSEIRLLKIHWPPSIAHCLDEFHSEWHHLCLHLHHRTLLFQFISIFACICLYLLYSWFWTIVLCVPAFLGVLKQWNFIGGYQGKSTSPYQIQVCNLCSWRFVEDFGHLSLEILVNSQLVILGDKKHLKCHALIKVGKRVFNSRFFWCFFGQWWSNILIWTTIWLANLLHFCETTADMPSMASWQLAKNNPRIWWIFLTSATWRIIQGPLDQHFYLDFSACQVTFTKKPWGIIRWQPGKAGLLEGWEDALRLSMKHGEKKSDEFLQGITDDFDKITWGPWTFVKF